MCDSCRWKLHNCPVCRSKLGSNRSLAAEKVRDLLPFKCKFFSLGCKEKLPSEERKQHQTVCPCREVQCPYSTCLKKLSILSFLDHIQEHKFIIGQGPGFAKSSSGVTEENFKTTTDLSWTVGHIKFQRQHFFSIFKRYSVSNEW